MRFLLLVFFFIFTLHASGQTCSRTVSWGNTSFCLPKLDGFVECLSDPSVKAAVDLTTHKNNTVLGAYLLKDEFGNFNNDDGALLTEYVRIETATRSKDMDFSQNDLEMLAEYMSTQLQSDEKMAKLLKEADEEFEMAKLSAPILLEELAVNEKSKTFVVINTLEKDAIQVVQICTMNLVCLKDRLLFVYYYNEYNGKESIEGAKVQTNLILTKLCAGNE